MGLFDTIRAVLPCPDCGSTKERDMQTKRGPCTMLDFEVGDTIEPFFYGDYWMEEEWDCDHCRNRSRTETRWHKAFIHCLNGLIIEVAPEKPSEGILPDWEMIHKLSRDRRNFRTTLRGIRNLVLDFRERTAAGERTPHPLLDFGPKTIDDLLSQILDDVERAERGEPPGWL